MATVERVVRIRCRPQEVLDLAMDIERYARFDDKLGRFDWVRREGDVLDFKVRPVLPGLPLPVPPIVVHARLTPGERIDVGLAPRPHNRLFHPLLAFDAGFAVTAVDGGTELRRWFQVEPRGALRPLIDPVLRRRLPADIDAELRGAARVLESDGSRDPR